MPGYGPAPKRPEDRARRNKPPVADTVLPRGGYEGPIPEWPMKGRKLVCDLELWCQYWRTPQAAAWVRMGPGAARGIARLVLLARSTSDKAAAEMRQLEDRFGLNPLAMRRLGWDVDRDGDDPLTEEDPGTVSTPSRYAGLRAVEG